MNSILGTNRRRQQDGELRQDDVREDLIAIALDGFLPLSILSAVCLVGATVVAAAFYTDLWLWVIAGAASVVSALRVAVVYAFGVETRQHGQRNYLFWFWASAFSLVTLLFCAAMALLTVYNFSVHDGPVQILCVMGTFTLCSGISSRLGLQPRVSQACIVLLQGALGWSLVSSSHPLSRLAALLTVVTGFFYCMSIHNQHKVIDDQVRTKRRLRNLANHDSLTGLPNRYLFDTTFGKVCAAGTPFTLWMLDLDGFKGVNDTWGHGVGDELLKQVAERLERTVRTGDLLARLGGDEFMILQPESFSRGATLSMAERINEEISAPYQIDGQKVQIGVSMGIKLASLGELSPHTALREVDRALYRVKDLRQGGFELV